MKPEVKKLVTAFAETAQSVKIRLKKSGFVVPVAHNGGIKYKHCYIKKDQHGWYTVSNLHNSRIKYYQNIASHKIAVAFAIYLGENAPFKEQELLDADKEYLHWWNEVRHFMHQISIARQRNNDIKLDIYTARYDEYLPRFQRAKQRVSHILNKAESLLFDTK